MNDWERDELVKELGGMIQEAAPQVQERFLWHLFMVHDDYGRRVGEYIGKTAEDVKHLEPLPPRPSPRRSRSASRTWGTTVTPSTPPSGAPGPPLW